MEQLGSFALLFVLVGIAGGLFALQYKLSLKEKFRWAFVLPMVFLTLYLAISTSALVKGNQYIDQTLSTTDYFGNILEMTVQVPKEGNRAALYSDLYIYDENHVLLDEISLSFKNGKMQSGFLYAGYEDEISKMTKGVLLNGSSMQREDVSGRVLFFGGSMEKKPFKVFALPFGIPALMLLLVGGLARLIQSKKLRIRSIEKIDIQSFHLPPQ